MKLVFATNNLNKLSEIQSLVPEEIEILSLKDIDCNEELPETKFTLEGNALDKATYVFENYGYNCFADDTGLEIDALNGEPGVYSARYAGENSVAEDNMTLVLQKLEGITQRTCIFRTVIALVIDGNITLFEGSCSGVIKETRSGVKGFGYDPIFMPSGFKKTFAEMNQNEKGSISHRGKAVKKLVEFLDSI